MFKTEKSSQFLLGIGSLVMALVLVLSSFGRDAWLSYVGIGVSVFLALFVFSEAAVLEYFKRSAYKSIGGGDIIVWVSIVFGTLLLANAVVMIPALDGAPAWLESLTSSTALVSGVSVAVLSVLHMVYPRFK